MTWNRRVQNGVKSVYRPSPHHLKYTGFRCIYLAIQSRNEFGPKFRGNVRFIGFSDFDGKPSRRSQDTGRELLFSYSVLNANDFRDFSPPVYGRFRKSRFGFRKANENTEFRSSFCTPLQGGGRGMWKFVIITRNPFREQR